MLERGPFKYGLFLFVLCILSISVGAQTLKVAAWNLESGDSTTNTLVTRVKTIPGVDVWGFSELKDQSVLNSMTSAADNNSPADFRSILGTTGGADRLAIVYNSTRLALVSSEELDEINVSGTVRAPLVALFRDTVTSKQFFFVVNHLYRGDPDGRHEQSRLLNDWAASQASPVITVGDFNYDLNVTNPAQHDEGFDLLTADGVFTWAQPPLLARTQCSFNSVLDFVFTSGEAQRWTHQSSIDAKPTDCPDDADKSDHRPIVTTFTLVVPPDGGTTPQPSRQEEIHRRILELERLLRELKELIDRP